MLKRNRNRFCYIPSVLLVLFITYARPAHPQPTGQLDEHSASDNSETEYIRVSDVQAAWLTHVTTVFLDKPVDSMRVFQAKPVQPIWYKKEWPDYLDSISTTAGAEQEETSKKDGFWWRWQLKSLKAGTYTFTTKFIVIAAARELMVDRLHLTWEQVAQSCKEVKADTLPQLPEDLVKTAQQMKRSASEPLEAVQMFCYWINHNIRYDTTTVQYPITDLASIMKYRKGWCGHRAMIFQGLCQAVGIPCRIVQGYYVVNQDGLWNGKEDWNRHGWAEVYLPKAGWVEVEPASENTPFKIPAHYIRTPSELQSEAVWVTQAEISKLHQSYRDTIRVQPASLPTQRDSSHASP